jgi:hypothetical protein
VTVLTLQQRAQAYRDAFPHFPASHLQVVTEAGGDCLYGLWVMGNDYRNRTAFYGAYPPGYLPRICALFPDVDGDHTLHVFAGSLPPGPYVRLDMVRDELRQPDVVGDVLEVDRLFAGRRFQLVMADPPYSAGDAEYYETPMISRRKVIGALADVVVPGGFLVWLDCVWPMHRKAEWRTVGRIGLIRCTNHRVRMVSIFQRRAA